MLCRPRDLVSQPLVIVGVVQEGYGHWRLGRKRVARICKKMGKRCVRDLLVKNLCGANSFLVECHHARATYHEVCRAALVHAFHWRWAAQTSSLNTVVHRSVRSTTGGLHCAPQRNMATRAMAGFRGQFTQNKPYIKH